MSLNYILLGLLRDPATGYDLKNKFNETVRHFWSAELSQIYPALKRMERRQLLRSQVEPSQKGPNRRVYSLTDDGRDHLLQWLRRGPVVGTERFAYLAQIYFMDAIGDMEKTRAFMAELRQHFLRWLAELRAVERAKHAAQGDAPEQFSAAAFHRFVTLRMGIHSIQAKIDWCDETLEAIDHSVAGAAGSEGEVHSGPDDPLP